MRRMSAESIPRMTPEQYLEVERAADFKSEYFAGRMYAMAGGTYPHAARLLESVDRRDIVMAQRGQCLRLALKSGDTLRIGGEGGGQNFDRDLAAENVVPGAIHLAHAALAEQRQDLVGANACRQGK